MKNIIMNAWWRSATMCSAALLLLMGSVSSVHAAPRRSYGAEELVELRKQVNALHSAKKTRANLTDDQKLDLLDLFKQAHDTKSGPERLDAERELGRLGYTRAQLEADTRGLVRTGPGEINYPLVERPKSYPVAEYTGPKNYPVVEYKRKLAAITNEKATPRAYSGAGAKAFIDDRLKNFTEIVNGAFSVDPNDSDIVGAVNAVIDAIRNWVKNKPNDAEKTIGEYLKDLQNLESMANTKLKEALRTLQEYRKSLRSGDAVVAVSMKLEPNTPKLMKDVAASVEGYGNILEEVSNRLRSGNKDQLESLAKGTMVDLAGLSQSDAKWIMDEAEKKLKALLSTLPPTGGQWFDNFKAALNLYNKGDKGASDFVDNLTGMADIDGSNIPQKNVKYLYPVAGRTQDFANATAALSPEDFDKASAYLKKMLTAIGYSKEQASAMKNALNKISEDRPEPTPTTTKPTMPTRRPPARPETTTPPPAGGGKGKYAGLAATAQNVQDVSASINNLDLDDLSEADKKQSLVNAKTLLEAAQKQGVAAADTDALKDAIAKA